MVVIDAVGGVGNQLITTQGEMRVCFSGLHEKVLKLSLPGAGIGGVRCHSCSRGCEKGARLKCGPGIREEGVRLSDNSKLRGQ